jgi:putative transcriptional regulator
MTKHREMSVFDQLQAGLEDSIAYSKGELSLKTSALPTPPPAATAGDVRALRQSLHMSQAVFAATLNVSKKTIQSWEQGLREPSDAALRMIQLVRLSPDVVSMFFTGNGASSRATITRSGRRPSSKVAI